MFPNPQKETALQASEARLSQLISANSSLNETLNASMASRERQAELEAELNRKVVGNEPRHEGHTKI